MASANTIYKVELRASPFRIKITDGTYAFPDCGSDGNIRIKHNVPEHFIVLQNLGDNIFTCSCNKKDVRARCIHMSVVEDFVPSNDTISDEDLVDAVYELPQTENFNLHGVFCRQKKTFGVIKKTSVQGKCLCCLKSLSCPHAFMFRKLTFGRQVAPPKKFTSISKGPIRYPLEDEDCKITMGYHTGTKYPTVLYPEYDEAITCECGHKFSSDDPILSGWLSTKRSQKSYIYTEVVTIEATVYYRPSVGECEHKQEYNGAKDLLFNLNNIHIFSYTWLIRIMYNISESKIPLAAAFQSANQQRIFLKQKVLNGALYRELSLAYNSFIRCLTILDNKYSFTCLQCPVDGPDEIVMDAITLGCKRGEMESNIQTDPDIEPITEFKEASEIVFSKVTRDRLANYVGKVKQVYIEDQVEMDEEEFQRLKQDLPLEFQNLLTEVGPFCPDSLRQFLGELSCASPISGIFQINGTDSRTAREILEEIAVGDFTRVRSHYKHLKKYAPLFCDLVKSQYAPDYVIGDVVKYVIEKIDASLNTDIPAHTHYSRTPTAKQVPLDYFPTKPPFIGKAIYTADGRRGDIINIQHCNKVYKKHPTLSPGVFTVLCKHGICHGFQLLDSAESPKTAFDLVLTKFGDKIPSIIIYDNCCHMHRYATKREPARFKDSKFLIDRFHSKNHTCTKGYDMSTYTYDKKISNINSQVAEQMNSHLVNLKSQIACMPSANAVQHIAVFLALRNLKKKLDYCHSKSK